MSVAEHGVQDRRVRRTRRILREALTALILEKGYDHITVQDVLDRADVGRSTFYSHFPDKEALRGGDQHERQVTQRLGGR